MKKDILVNDGTKIITNDLMYRGLTYVAWVFGVVCLLMGVAFIAVPEPNDIKGSYRAGYVVLVLAGIFLWSAQARKRIEITAESVTIARRLLFINKRTSTPISDFRTLRIYYNRTQSIGQDTCSFYDIVLSRQLVGSPKRYTMQQQEINLGISFKYKEFDELVKLCRSLHALTGLEYFFDYEESFRDCDELNLLEEKLTGAMSPNTKEQ